MRRTTRPLVLALGFLLLVAAGVGALINRRARPPFLRAVAARPVPSPPPSAADDYAKAAAAYRRGDLAQVEAVLSTLAKQDVHERSRAMLVLGLHQYASAHYQAATTLLQKASDPTGELEDWRLFALADAAARVNDNLLADKALAQLLARGGSPLRGRALVVAAQRAWDSGDTERALGWISLGRSQPIPPAIATDLEVLAWRMGVALGDRAIERAAGMRLLTIAPSQADDLGVIDLFKDKDGNIDNWDGVLTRSQVEQRAAAWLAVDQALAASNTLSTIRVAERDVRWFLLQAEALTDQQKGGLAYSLLRSVFPEDRQQAASLEWQRALAATDVATASSSRDDIQPGDRPRMLELAQQHLRRALELGADRATSQPALRKLYVALTEAGRFDESMQMLALLRKLDPTDRTGASHLWEQGWSEFEKKNYTGAVGYWTQLEELYPHDPDTNRGRYWKGRALDELGQRGHARDEYRAVLAEADTADFYVRQASARLGGDVEPQQRPGSLSPPWPAKPVLRRVLALSNFGLDALARVELAGLSQDNPADPDQARDMKALEGILTVREGNARIGVQSLRAAFPSLGGPFQAAVPRPVLEAYYPIQFDEAIRENARQNGLPPSLVAGIIRQESSFDVNAKSPVGARGLMQLMPATAKEWAARLGVPASPDLLYDPNYSIRLGTAYFANVLNRMDGNVELALAGYNGGPNRILRMWREAGMRDDDLDLFLERLDIDESQAYVKRILVLADSYRQLYPAYAS
jgi:soluble lytic murein transglycosylase-like protein